MELRTVIKKAGQEILDLLFPISCLVCGKDGKYLCDSCQVNLPRLEAQQCLVCQTPSPFGKTHLDCVSRNTVNGAIAALPYKQCHVNKLIETFKYNFVSDLAKPLVACLLQEIAKQNLSDYFSDFVIVPVPLHSRRYNWRGFNQAELMAQALSQGLGLKVDTKMVIRNRFTKPQTKLDALQRKRNIENAFSLIGNAVNKKILLVDDVVTSGSTAQELAKLLKHAHAAEVWLTTVAHG